MLEHGGRVLAAARRWNIAPAHWLDLSTGISPWSWIEDRGLALDASCWRRLPEDGDDALERVASAHYGAPALVLAGSQAAIQVLPQLRPRACVGVLAPGYTEHAQRWAQAGHALAWLRAADIDGALPALQVLVLCNPNNPDGARFTRERLLGWHAALAARGGWLIVDEAFADADDADSVARDAQRPGLVVLRSLGKFFGLAGARVGFALCDETLRETLRRTLGPWCVAGPAREVALHALRDRDWQQRQAQRLRQAGQRLAVLLAARGLPPRGGCALFQLVHGGTRQAEALAARGILVRRFAAPEGLRFGLPRDEADWQRLDSALRVLPREAA